MAATPETPACDENLERPIISRCTSHIEATPRGMGLMHPLFHSSSQDNEPPKAIIFDWDDTICPSSYLDRFKIERVDHLPRHVSRCMLSLCLTNEFRVIQDCLDQIQRYRWLVLFSLCLDKLQFRCILTGSFSHDLRTQFQKLFAEISRLAARMLHEASKYGEVGLLVALR